jgi:hypothetical protein
MDSNTHSPNGTVGPADPLAAQPPVDDDDEAELVVLAAVLDRLAARDLDRLTDSVRASRALRLRPLVERLEGQWLTELAGVDARGAAGADQGVQVGATAGWLRARLRMGSHAAAEAVRTARALFCGPLPQTAEALCARGDLGRPCRGPGRRDQGPPGPGDHGRRTDPAGRGRRLDPSGLRPAGRPLRSTLDPEDADARAQRGQERRGWLTVSVDRMWHRWAAGS